MELKDIKKIIELMKENDLSEFEMEDQAGRIAVKRGGAMVVPSLPAMSVAPVPVIAGNNGTEVGGNRPAEEASWLAVKSPMVGTFYRAPAPDAEVFVKIGQEVTPETVVCIIEAMKVMNEIKAEVSGVVRKVVTENTTPVEYGQVLFLVEPKNV